MVFLFPLFLVALVVGFKLAWPQLYIRAIQEDSPLEHLQAATYFAAAIGSAGLAWRFSLARSAALLAVLYALLTAALLLVTLEEISWGQRIFSIATPGWFSRHNQQHELTLHNLDGVQEWLHLAYCLVGAFGAFGWLLAWPLSKRASPGQRKLMGFIVPDWFVSPNFFFVLLIYALLEYIARPHRGGFLVWRDQEVAEAFLSLGFLIFVVTNHLKLSRQP